MASHISQLEAIINQDKQDISLLSGKLNEAIQQISVQKTVYENRKQKTENKETKIEAQFPNISELPQIREDWEQTLRDCETVNQATQNALDIAIEKSQAQDKVIKDQDEEVYSLKSTNEATNQELKRQINRKKWYRLGFGGAVLVILGLTL